MDNHIKIFMEARMARANENKRIQEEYFGNKNYPYRITQKRLDEYLDQKQKLLEKHNPYERNDPEWEKRHYRLETFPQQFPEFLEERHELDNEYGLPTVGGMFEVIEEGEEECQPDD